MRASAIACAPLRRLQGAEVGGRAVDLLDVCVRDGASHRRGGRVGGSGGGRGGGDDERLALVSEVLERPLVECLRVARA